MSERTYSQVNTGISVREASFLSPAQFDALLTSPDAEARASLLQGTAYALEADQLRQVQVVEQALMKHLLAEYDWAYQVAPNPAVVDLFALKYTYHNLKVFHQAFEMIKVSQIHADFQNSNILIVDIFLPGRCYFLSHKLWTVL